MQPMDQKKRIRSLNRKREPLNKFFKFLLIVSTIFSLLKQASGLIEVTTGSSNSLKQEKESLVESSTAASSVDNQFKKRSQDLWFLEQNVYPHQHSPYNFGYDIRSDSGSSGNYRRESSDPFGRVTGSYGFWSPDPVGAMIFRHVDYVADESGFHARVRTSEPGTETSDPADAPLTSFNRHDGRGVPFAPPFAPPESFARSLYPPATENRIRTDDRKSPSSGTPSSSREYFGSKDIGSLPESLPLPKPPSVKSYTQYTPVSHVSQQQQQIQNKGIPPPSEPQKTYFASRSAYRPRIMTGKTSGKTNVAERRSDTWGRKDSQQKMQGDSAWKKRSVNPDHKVIGDELFVDARKTYPGLGDSPNTAATAGKLIRHKDHNWWIQSGKISETQDPIRIQNLFGPESLFHQPSSQGNRHKLFQTSRGASYTSLLPPQQLSKEKDSTEVEHKKNPLLDSDEVLFRSRSWFSPPSLLMHSSESNAGQTKPKYVPGFFEIPVRDPSTTPDPESNDSRDESVSASNESREKSYNDKPFANLIRFDDSLRIERRHESDEHENITTTTLPSVTPAELIPERHHRSWMKLDPSIRVLLNTHIKPHLERYLNLSSSRSSGEHNTDARYNESFSRELNLPEPSDHLFTRRDGSHVSEVDDYEDDGDGEEEDENDVKTDPVIDTNSTQTPDANRMFTGSVEIRDKEAAADHEDSPSPFHFLSDQNR